MKLRLPERGRPQGVRYRACELGVDLSSQFVNDLKSLDRNLYPIFHPYQLLWDDIVNEYAGALVDPRYPVAENSFRCGELVLGHVLSNGRGEPTLDGHWHIWRWCEPAPGWAHVINIDSTDRLYLRLLVERLWLQARYNDKFGHRGYQRMMEEADIAKREKIQADKADLMKDIASANSDMMSRAMQNFASGKVAATNPTKEVIMSGSGLRNRSKIVRPLSDTEGGLILPESMKD